MNKVSDDKAADGTPGRRAPFCRRECVCRDGGDSVPAAPAEERVRVGGDGLFQPSAERVPGGDGRLCGGREGLQPREKSSTSSERLLGLSVPPFVSGSHVMTCYNP